MKSLRWTVCLSVCLSACRQLPVRFLFDSEDLLDALSHIDCGNFSSHMPKHSYWGMIKVWPLAGSRPTDPGKHSGR